MGRGGDGFFLSLKEEISFSRRDIPVPGDSVASFGPSLPCVTHGATQACSASALKNRGETSIPNRCIYHCASKFLPPPTIFKLRIF